MSKKIKECLKLLYNGIDTTLFEVAIAGSFAMYCYMKFVLGMTLEWEPNDCDVYICTEDNEKFNLVTENFVRKLRVQRVKHKLLGDYENNYALDGVKLRLRDVVFLRGRATTVSFIQVKSKNNIPDVIRDFDIDVCKVALYFKHNEYVLAPLVRESLQLKRAAIVREFIWDRRAPDPVELHRLILTYRRMYKYQKRGFLFSNSPFVDSVENGAVRELTLDEVDAIKQEW